SDGSWPTEVGRVIERSVPRRASSSPRRPRSLMPDLARSATFLHRADRRVDSASAGRRRRLLPASRFLAFFAAIGLLVGTAATSVLADTPPPPAGATPVSGSITFFGRGYGHGV